MKNNFNFTSQEKEQIENAIQSLEKESSGEIVLYFAKNSDNYLEACWKAGAIFGLFITSILSILSYYWLLPSIMTTPLTIGIVIIIAMVIGILVPLLIPITRLSFISDSKVNHRVLTKARDIFLQEEVFKTVDRTGILIYISKFEHIVEVLGDSGINSKIEQKDWDYVVGLILNGIKNDKPVDGLVQAIDACKKLLLDNEFIVREDDTDELSNEIRIE